MEENEIPDLGAVLGKSKSTDKKPINFIDMAQKSLNKGTGVDPLFFSDVVNELKKDGVNAELVFDDESRKKVREKYGDEGLKQWEELFDSTVNINKASGDHEFYESYAAPTLFNRARGFKNFEVQKESTSDLQGEFARGFESNIAIKTPEMIAENAPSIIDYDPLKGFHQREVEPGKIDSIVSMFGENKQLTIATNEVVANVDPEVKRKIKEGILDPKSYFKDEQGLYRYRTLQKGERPTDNIRSVWGPQMVYHNSYAQELLESLNDFAMDSLDAAMYIGQLPTGLALNGTQKIAHMLGITDASWADPWNDNLNDYRNWSQSRRSTGSWEDQEGTFSNFTNFSKGVVQIVSQIVATRGMGLIGGLGAKGTSATMQYLGKTLSDDAARAIMSRTALGYNFMYAGSMANEQARQAGLDATEGHAMALASGAVMVLTEKLTGGQFTDKVFGPIRSKAYTKKILDDVTDQLKALNIKPSEALKDKKTFGSIVGNALTRTHQWLSDTAETRMQNTVQGFFGEAIQETSEDGMNMLVQEFRDYMAGEDSYDNTWASAVHQLSESFVLGGIGGAFGGAAFFDKKHWEMSYVDESKFDWITVAALKGELKDARNALDKARKEGTLGSTLYSAMQGSHNTPLSLETDPVAISQNELLYQQFSAQMNLAEEMVEKYKKYFTNDELGDFMMSVTGGKEFVNSDEFADVKKNTAHMMQREAVAFEVKRNHAKSMLALEIARANQSVDLSEVESVQSFKGKVISVKMKGQDTPAVPNTVTKNVLEQALRNIEDGDGDLADVKKEYNELYLRKEELEEAQYNADKNPLNQEFAAIHKQAKEEFEKQADKYESALSKAKMGDSVTEMLDDLTNFDNLEADFKNGERSKFYNQKAILEMAKRQYAKYFAGHDKMSVYDTRMKAKDREFFKGSIAFEDQSRAEVAAKYDQLVAEMQGLKGADLEAKLSELLQLNASTKMLFLSPESVKLVESKVQELVHSNKFLSTADLNMFKIKSGEQLNEEKIAEILRIILSISEATGNKQLDEDTLQELEGYKNMGIPLHQAVMGMQGYMKDDSLPALLDALDSRLGEVFENLEILKNAGINYPSFNIDEMEAVLGMILSDSYDEYQAGQNVVDQLKSLSKAEPLGKWIETMKAQAVSAFHKITDFSAWEGEDLEVLARAFNTNQSRNDMAGGSILSKLAELQKEAKDFKDEFSDIVTVEALKKELDENRREVILQHTMDDWGLENGSEKFKQLMVAMEIVDSILSNLHQAAQANMNKRAGRDYKIKQDYINFTSKALIQLNGVIGALTPEEVDELSKLLVVSGETFNQEQKDQIDQRMERLIDFEEKVSKALQDELKKEGRAKEILDAMNLSINSLFTLNATNNVTRSAFRDLHEDIDSPYDPKNEQSAKEQLFNFLVQLERGNVRTFFNRFNQILSEEKADTTLLPSFEQALSARQLFGFLMDQNKSEFKSALNAEFKPMLDRDGKEISKPVMDNHQIFVRGIAGAGKSTFVTKLAFELFGDQMEKAGTPKKVIYSAPNPSQVENIGKTMGKAEGEGLSTASFELNQLYAMKGFSGGILEGVGMIVIDEATLESDQLTKIMNELAKHNESAADGNKIKLILIGDEFQNGPESMFVQGMPLFYNWSTNAIIERTVPLTSPYRTGKIESFSLQMSHRKIISEFNKIQKALNYSEPYINLKGEKVVVTDQNWNALAAEVFNHFNSAKAFNYFEKKPGIIDFGLKSSNKKEDVLKGFLDKLADSENKSDVAMIVDSSQKSEIISELGRMAANMGLQFDSGSLAPYVYSSQEIQGLSIPHVFVAIDIEEAIKSSQKIGILKTVFQAMYVAESREQESLTIWLPGNHASLKQVSKNAIFSYPKVEMTDTKEDGTPTEQVLELQKENRNLVALIQKLSRPEDSDPENNKPNETEEESKTKGEEEKEKEKPAGKKTPKPKPKMKTKEQKEKNEADHDKNMKSKAWEKAAQDPDKFFEQASEKYKTMDDLFKALEEDQDGTCNL